MATIQRTYSHRGFDYRSLKNLGIEPGDFTVVGRTNQPTMTLEFDDSRTHEFDEALNEDGWDPPQP